MSVMRIVAIVAVAVIGCRDEPSPPAPQAGSDRGSAAAPADAVASPADAADLKQHMREHFAAISELQAAIARGHLDDAKALAAWLGSHDEPHQEGWEPFVTELKSAAKGVEQAPDLPTAASLAARLGRACSKCHEARGAVVTFEWTPAPDNGPTLAAQMKRHQWAAARLWDGLVGPADALWQEGATVLATTRLDTAQAAKGSERADLPVLAAQIRKLATRAIVVTDHDARAKLYGELLSTCAGCHQLARPQPVP